MIARPESPTFPRSDAPTLRPSTPAARWCFSTLGCPELSLPEVCQLAVDFGIPSLELRALWNGMDLPSCTVKNGFGPDQATSLLQQNQLQVIVAGSSFKLASYDEKSRTEFLSFCDWAEAWGIPYVRVFGGGSWSSYGPAGTSLTERDLDQAAKTVEWWRDERQSRGWRIEALLETHDAFSGSRPCVALNQRLQSPIGIIWDSHHTWRLAGESPAESWSQLSSWVRHVHLKDSIDKPSARHPYTYVLPGDGQAPLEAILAILREHAFAGCVSLEWERLWHPYLSPLRSALAHLQSRSWYV